VKELRASFDVLSLLSSSFKIIFLFLRRDPLLPGLIDDTVSLRMSCLLPLSFVETSFSTQISSVRFPLLNGLFSTLCRSKQYPPESTETNPRPGLGLIRKHAVSYTSN